MRGPAIRPAAANTPPNLPDTVADAPLEFSTAQHTARRASRRTADFQSPSLGCHLIKLDVGIPLQQNQQLACAVLRAFDRCLGHVTASNCVQRIAASNQPLKSMGCSLMECLEGIRNPCKSLKKWSGRRDSNP